MKKIEVPFMYPRKIVILNFSPGNKGSGDKKNGQHIFSNFLISFCIFTEDRF